MKKWQHHRDNNPAFCILPFSQSHINTDGSCHVCCVGDWDHALSRDITKEGILNIWKGDKYKNIRQQMLAGERPVVCQGCYNLDDAAGGSDRSMLTNNFHDPHEDWDIDIQAGNTDGIPSWLDWRPGNFCNLKCRMCFPSASSGLMDELTDNKELNPYYGHDGFEIGNWLDDPDRFEEFKKIIPYVNKLKIAGGEPMFMQGVINMFRYCVDNDLAKNISLDITTNGTRKQGKVLRMLTEFKTLDVNFSIDGIAQSHDYIRYPSKISEILQHYKEYQQIAKTTILMTVQMYNIFEIPSVIEWWYENNKHHSYEYNHKINFNFVIVPKDLDVRLLPQRYKQQVVEEIKQVLDKIQLSEELQRKTRIADIIHRLTVESTGPEIGAKNNLTLEQKQKQFVKRTIQFDIIRNQSIRSLDPRLVDIFETWEKQYA